VTALTRWYPAGVAAAGLIAVGSGAAGMRAAETFRRLHPRLPVQILTADAAMPYARSPLDKDFLHGDATSVELHEPGWFDRHDIEVVRGVTVRSIDPVARHVVTSGGRRYPYWHLVLACGSTPVLPGDAGPILTLRSFADAVALRMTVRYADSAVVMGAGLIGCEVAGHLAARGVATTLLDARPLPLLGRFGRDVGVRVLNLLRDSGVRFLGGVRVSTATDGGVVLDSGETLEADLVLAATGKRPASELAAAAGLRTSGGRIVVDEHMHTSAPDVFAAGEVALAWNRTARRRIPVEHWTDAAAQGEVAGASAAGARATWDAVPGFGFTVAGEPFDYVGWGTGYDSSRLVEHDGGFTVWYRSAGAVVGVLSAGDRPVRNRPGLDAPKVAAHQAD
jgi:3-phenylpropionate/trans-cinnamate dioxygenase ferredoxin reductase component